MTMSSEPLTKVHIFGSLPTLMNLTLLLVTQLGFILCSLGCLILILIGLKKILGRTNIPASKQTRIFIGTVFILSLWILFISIFALQGFFSNFSTVPPRMFIVLVLPMAFILWLTFRPGFKSILVNTPGQWLIYIQTFRVVVELLLWLMLVQGITPVQMTFEGLNFDILAGLTAPLFAYLIYSKRTLSTKVLVYWNFAGLLLLGNIVIIAILSFPTPLRQFMNDPPNTAVAEFPFIWLPGILVIIAYSMHLFSLRQLYLTKSS